MPRSQQGLRPTGRARPARIGDRINGNAILDVHGLTITDRAALESELNQLPGVVTNGLFARRPADVLLLGTPEGVKRIDRP